MNSFVQAITQGQVRAVARAMTWIENSYPGAQELLQALYPLVGRAQTVGVTGPPGAGKSTLVDQFIRHLRGQGKRVGVLAVDPSSPFTGGALLGDRVRMIQHSNDPGVFIRSMGSRGSLGGLATTTHELMVVLEASGCDVILLETVGVGQGELDVMSVADTVVLVLTPGAGDHVQTAKAGIMEIADVFAVNKAELPGADGLVRELQRMLQEKSSHRENWCPPILRTVAEQGVGVADLWQATQKHRNHLYQSGHERDRRQRRHRNQALHLMEAACGRELRRWADSDPKWQDLLLNQLEQDPYTVSALLLADLPCLFAPPPRHAPQS
ncbi:methylmalonyl Co-A mutase-associated GTPase MeaB [Alicyclobacillaceae bacterium I2511]|nr:methylmalonyl Co-A mutase-associated GTPase MeaB [Alicyclobacillaceae bacterium I2511]